MWVVLGIFIFWCLVFILTSIRERRARLRRLRALFEQFDKVQDYLNTTMSPPRSMTDGFITELTEFSKEDEVHDDQVDAIATALTASILNPKKPAFKILKEKTDD